MLDCSSIIEKEDTIAATLLEKIKQLAKPRLLANTVHPHLSEPLCASKKYFCSDN